MGPTSCCSNHFLGSSPPPPPQWQRGQWWIRVWGRGRHVWLKDEHSGLPVQTTQAAPSPPLHTAVWSHLPSATPGGQSIKHRLLSSSRSYISRFRNRRQMRSRAHLWLPQRTQTARTHTTGTRNTHTHTLVCTHAHTHAHSPSVLRTDDVGSQVWGCAWRDCSSENVQAL